MPNINKYLKVSPSNANPSKYSKASSLNPNISRYTNGLLSFINASGQSYISSNVTLATKTCCPQVVVCGRKTNVLSQGPSMVALFERLSMLIFHNVGINYHDAFVQQVTDWTTYTPLVDHQPFNGILLQRVHLLSLILKDTVSDLHIPIA